MWQLVGCARNESHPERGARRPSPPLSPPHGVFVRARLSRRAPPEQIGIARVGRVASS
ncbi:hypothetical protein BDY21DRAFT_188711 [Lineolata rhizophorae]|uniref:Uncharacterized protein n=1 Tax=Lineolata rhizophorae TaxID=578093 RepID=A0A6A6P5P7_9PEZI|nr:hypothetical protein BDY21DRAFT_188711 [Lineolata rhizophorae]